MKLSNRRFRVKDLEKMREIISEDNTLMRLDEILEKVKNNPEERLSQEETDFLKSNVEKLQEESSDCWVGRMIKATGDKDFIKACLEDKSFNFNYETRMDLVVSTRDLNYIEKYIEDDKNYDKLSLIERLKDLESMQEKISVEFGNFKLSRYEWQILRWIKENKFGLNEFEKADLITDTKNPILYSICLLENKLLNSYGKRRILEETQKLENITTNQYLKIVMNAIQSKELQLKDDDKACLLNNLKNIKELIEPTEELEIGNKKIKISQYDRVIENVIMNYKKIFEDDTLNKELFKQQLIGYASSLDVIDVLVGELEPDDRVSVILNTNNEEYIRKCIENEELYLGASGREILILGLKDEGYIKACLANPTLAISPTGRARVVIKGIKDEEYRRNCLTDDTFDIDLEAKEMLINNIGSEEDKEKWNSRILNVKDISQLSLEELMALPEDAIIKTEDNIYNYYKKDEYVQVRKKMNEILDGIEFPIPGDEETELKTFLEVSRRLAMHISYDEFAILKAGKKDYKLQKECRNLYGGLVKGECVCVGYAVILKNALACLGIEAKDISGADLNSNSGHAWNQVKIGGKWYNTDLTWERNKIVRTGVASKEMLKSDKEFEDHNMYNKHRYPSQEVCSESMKDRAEPNKSSNRNKKEQDETEI